MLIKNIILVIIGLTSGVAVAGGVFAFITMIGIIPRMASRTDTAKHMMLYEDAVTLGGSLANAAFIFQWKLPVGVIGMIIFALSSGIFIGCLAVALAEVLDVVPVFAKRINLTQGMPVIVLSLALGKCLGSLYQLFFK